MAAMALTVSGLAAAVNDTLSPGEVLTKQINVDEGDWIDYSWDSSADLTFVLRDPNNVVRETSISSSDWGLYTALMDGTYTLTWTNTQTTDVTIDYEATRVPLGGGEGLFEDIWQSILIAVVIIAIIIVVIIVLVVYVLAKDKKPAAPQYAPPPMQAVPMGPAPTNCPTCGVPLDPAGAFCQKCGARIR
ncbi:MAG: hypothetical protein A3K76_02430 [Euryarchaeota archaeon RBG_13_57_23]|nr:MAG: hypothetical protein A3K76_02430 [Euryarchaeota archaeon RBG_13_57_23]